MLASAVGQRLQSTLKAQCLCSMMFNVTELSDPCEENRTQARSSTGSKARANTYRPTNVVGYGLRYVIKFRETLPTVGPIPESLLLLASPNPLPFERLTISKSWAFFLWYKDFFNVITASTDQIGTHSCLVHITQNYLGHQAGNKSSRKLFYEEEWAPGLQFKMNWLDCTVLANLGFPFERYKGQLL